MLHVIIFAVMVLTALSTVPTRKCLAVLASFCLCPFRACPCRAGTDLDLLPLRRIFWSIGSSSRQPQPLPCTVQVRSSQVRCECVHVAVQSTQNAARKKKKYLDIGFSTQPAVQPSWLRGLFTVQTSIALRGQSGGRPEDTWCALRIPHSCHQKVSVGTCRLLLRDLSMQVKARLCRTCAVGLIHSLVDIFLRKRLWSQFGGERRAWRRQLPACTLFFFASQVVT